MPRRKKHKNRVYIAGPISSDNLLTALDNISLGIQVATKLIKAGYSPFCPMLDFQYRIMSGEITREMYQRQSMDWLEVSDAIILLPGWTNSTGALAEYRRAMQLEIPICYWSVFDEKKSLTALKRAVE